MEYAIKKDKEILAGIYGNLIMNNILSIEVLYVTEAIRNKGYGSKLLEKIEKKAKAEGAYLAQLDTFDFQGLGFYKKNGYVVFGILDDCPAPTHQRYYLKKRLRLLYRRDRYCQYLN